MNSLIRHLDVISRVLDTVLLVDEGRCYTLSKLRLVHPTLAEMALARLYEHVYLDTRHRSDSLPMRPPMEDHLESFLSVCSSNGQIPRHVKSITISCPMPPPNESVAEVSPLWITSHVFNDVVLRLAQHHRVTTLQINPSLPSGSTSGLILSSALAPLATGLTNLYLHNITAFPILFLRQCVTVTVFRTVRVEYATERLSASPNCVNCQ
ncbi:hypothetical protein BKA70DRAFT_1356866 [Coprinopsis sp. MPI-PUGE-AT-0042]|nr:hypothetical protein BKA70DRAFT_1356866 [Coprinopsis sp. MPI-PUGE-AT-0042]